MHVYFGATHPSIGLDSDGLDSPLPEPIGRPCSAEDIKFDELKEWCSKALANGTLEHFNDIERRKNAGSVDPDKYKVWHTTIKTAVDDSEPAFWKLVVDEENFDLTNCYRNEPRPNIIRLCARRAVVLPVEEEEAAEEPKASEARSEQQAQGEEGSIEQEDDDREEEEEEEEEESHRGGKRKRDEFEGSSTVQDQSEDQGDDTEPSDGDVSQPESLASKVIGLPTVVDLTLEDSD